MFSMKRLKLASLFVLLTTSSYALEVGLTGGGTYSYLITTWFSDGTPVFYSMPVYMNWTTNWKLGVFATYPLPIAKLTAEGSLLYDIKGGAWRGINESIEINKYLYSLLHK